MSIATENIVGEQPTNSFIPSCNNCNHQKVCLPYLTMKGMLEEFLKSNEGCFVGENRPAQLPFRDDQIALTCNQFQNTRHEVERE